MPIPINIRSSLAPDQHNPIQLIGDPANPDAASITLTSRPHYQTIDLEPGPDGITILIHQQGIKVDVPSFVEINLRSAIACLENLSQAQWEWISQGQIFKVLIHIVFRGTIKAPHDIYELLQEDMGVQHMAGGIIMACEAFFAGKSVFWRNPENCLHPGTEQILMTMINAMMLICGISKKDPKHNTWASNYAEECIMRAVKELEGEEAAKRKTLTQDEADEEHKRVTLQYLQKVAVMKGMDHPIASLPNNPLTVKNMIANVEQNTPTGRQFIKLIIKK